MVRMLGGKWHWLIRALAITLALFQLYTSATTPLPSIQQRSLHVGLAVSLALLSWSPRGGKRSSKGGFSIYDLLLVGLLFVASINAFLKYEYWFQHLSSTTTIDIILGTLTLLIVVEAARRIAGWVFPILVGFSLLYGLFGFIIPGKFGHGGFGWKHWLIYLYQTGSGMWGSVTGISATVVAIFLVFGAFLLFTGGGASFMDLAKKIAGRYTGGPALVAVVGSSFFGTVSGSVVANVAATGNFTIPMMKKLGYRPEFAGGVEATASTGGQIMPPIMGAGAFIMAEMVGVSYLSVAIAAIIPAVLYYVAVFSGTYFEAKKLNLPPMAASEIPPWRQILTYQKIVPFILPVITLFYFLVAGYSIIRACFWATVIAAIVYIFANFRWQDMKQRFKTLVHGLEEGGMSIAGIAALLVCANIVIAVIGQTGIGVKFSELIMTAAQQNLLLALILVAIAVTILGMGMPTAPAYVLGAAIMATPLMSLGIEEFVVHFFIFYFACLSPITPPVCLGVYTAAGIARAPWLSVAGVALRLAIVAFILPFAFVYEPSLLFLGKATLVPTLTALIGSLCLAAAAFGYLGSRLNILTRAFTGAAGIMLFIPGVETDVWAAPLLILAVTSQLFVSRFIRRVSPAK